MLKSSNLLPITKTCSKMHNSPKSVISVKVSNTSRRCELTNWRITKRTLRPCSAKSTTFKLKIQLKLRLKTRKKSCSSVTRPKFTSTNSSICNQISQKNGSNRIICLNGSDARAPSSPTTFLTVMNIATWSLCLSGLRWYLQILCLYMIKIRLKRLDKSKKRSKKKKMVLKRELETRKIRINKNLKTQICYKKHRMYLLNTIFPMNKSRSSAKSSTKWTPTKTVSSPKMSLKTCIKA